MIAKMRPVLAKMKHCLRHVGQVKDRLVQRLNHQGGGEELDMDISPHEKIQPTEVDLRAFEEMQKNTQEEIHGKLAVSIARLANVIE